VPLITAEIIGVFSALTIDILIALTLLETSLIGPIPHDDRLTASNEMMQAVMSIAKNVIQHKE
jgi:hypothetical protein